VPKKTEAPEESSDQCRDGQLFKDGGSDGEL
jgi:hypothetical protein